MLRRQSAALSWRIFLYASRALSNAASAAGRSAARIPAFGLSAGAFCRQHASTAFKHHSADFLLARIGLSPTRTNTGFVWLDGRTRRHTQLLILIGTANVTSCS